MRNRAALSVHVRGGVAAIALAVLVSGCGSNQAGTAGGAGSGSSGGPTTSSSGPPASSPPTSSPPTSEPTASPAPGGTGGPGSGGTGKPLPVPPTGGAGQQGRVSGTIIEGVAPTCRILQTANRRYALTGPGTQSLRVGERVSASGVQRPDLISPCGQTFVVQDLTVS